MTTKGKENVKLLKEEVINVRCTKQQMGLLKEVAGREGLGVSSWLLHVGIREAQERQAAIKDPR